MREPTQDFKEITTLSKPNKDKQFKLSMIDSPGFGDNSDIEEWRNKIIKYMTNKII